MADSPSYTSLYRRFRPQRFSEVLGQDHVTKALQNAVSQERISHAYLFSGPRGTGKTSTARILAKALNCMAPIEGEPCCICDSCVSIAEGRSFDVIELDAASNSGVDSIRTLIAQAPTGTFGKWKLYIIDEVHMLSTAASNALLKTLEEPPSHVIFVLATTDPQKVISTLKSRTQHYEFRFLDNDSLSELIESVKDRADLNLDNEAIAWLLQRGGGSARDTLSYLDQLVALGSLPEAGLDLKDLIQALVDQDVAGVIEAVDALLRSGLNPQRICVDLIAYFRSAFLSSLGSPDPKDNKVDLPFSSTRLIRVLQILGETLGTMRDSLDPRIMLEVALIKVSSGDSDPFLAGLSARVDALEKVVQSLSSSGVAGVQSKAIGNLSSGADVQAGTPEPSPRGVPLKGAGSVAQPIKEGSQTRPTPVRSKEQVFQELRGAMEGAHKTTEMKDLPESDEKPIPPPSPFSDSETGTLVSKVARNDQAGEDVTKTLGEGQKGSASVVQEWATDLNEANQIFRQQILPLLAPRARSLYAAGRLVSTRQNKVILSLPNMAHKSHAMGNLGDVRQAFSAYLKRSDLVVELTSDGELGPTKSEETEPDNSVDLMEQFSSAAEVIGEGVETQILEVFPGAKKVDQ